MLAPMRILFLCTGNSCRSQIAEGLCRHLADPSVEVASAGTRPAGVHPRTVKTMAERGIDIGGQTSDTLEQVGAEFDLMITLCHDAAEKCSSLTVAREGRHWPIADPVRATGSEAEVQAAFRTARDEIELRVTQLLEEFGLARSG